MKLGILFVRTLVSIAIVCCCLAKLVAQTGQPAELRPNQLTTFSLSSDDSRTFPLHIDGDGFAEINWLASDQLTLEYAFADASGKVLEVGDSTEHDSAIFIAPQSGKYLFLIKLAKDSEVIGSQRVSIEYKTRFSLPPKSRLKETRKINGFDIKILYAPGEDADFGDSIVLFEKAGKLKKILKSGGNPTFIGYSFPDNPANAKTAAAKRALAYIQTTPDKTGDGIPDVMIDYYSGGAHCCFSTYFINLGDMPAVAERIDTENAGLVPIGKDAGGGLRFQTNDNAFAYWNMSFAGSPMPLVNLAFVNGELRPDFLSMKKAPPSLTSLRSKARAARAKMSNEAYTEVGMDFEDAFWSEMLELIYSGNEELAWQYFELVWPSTKPGKEKFATDFREQLALSYYGTRSINANSSFHNYMRLFEKLFKKNL